MKNIYEYLKTFKVAISFLLLLFIVINILFLKAKLNIDYEITKITYSPDYHRAEHDAIMSIGKNLESTTTIYETNISPLLNGIIIFETVKEYDGIFNHIKKRDIEFQCENYIFFLLTYLGFCGSFVSIASFISNSEIKMVIGKKKSIPTKVKKK
jgi:hypothetical protein